MEKSPPQICEGPKYTFEKLWKMDLHRNKNIESEKNNKIYNDFVLDIVINWFIITWKNKPGSKSQIKIFELSRLIKTI